MHIRVTPKSLVYEPRQQWRVGGRVALTKLQIEQFDRVIRGLEGGVERFDKEDGDWMVKTKDGDDITAQYRKHIADAARMLARLKNGLHVS